MTKLNKQKWLKIGAVTLASGVLVGALTYYNFLVPETVGAVLLEQCPQFTVDYIYTAKDGKMVIDEDKTFTMAEQSGKVVVLNFWATYCQPCKVEIPHFNELYENYHDRGLEVVILNGEMDKTAQGLLDNFVNNDNPNRTDDEYDKYYGAWQSFHCTFGRYESDNNVLELFEVSSLLPVTVVINRAGIIKYMDAASLTYEELEQIVLPELEEV